MVFNTLRPHLYAMAFVQPRRKAYRLVRDFDPEEPMIYG